MSESEWGANLSLIFLQLSSQSCDGVSEMTRVGLPAVGQSQWVVDPETHKLP